MSMAEWFQQLYGPRQILYDPKDVDFDPLADAAVQDPVPNVPTPGGGNAVGGSKDGAIVSDPWSYIADRGGVPYANDSLYFATPGWSPDISWKTVAKAYGPYMALGPLTGGLRMAAAFKNPTQDPAWQEAARQYLAKYAPGTSLTDVIKQINTLYAADPTAKVFASDTARGVMMGAGHLADPYSHAVMQTGVMSPHTFAQSAMGFMGMGMDPASVSDFGWSTPTEFSTVQDPVTGLWGSEYSQYQSAPLAAMARAYLEDVQSGTGSFYDSINNKFYGPGEYSEEVAGRIDASVNQRALSRSWMEDILNEKTTLSFAEWQRERSQKDVDQAYRDAMDIARGMGTSKGDGGSGIGGATGGTDSRERGETYGGGPR